jgi:hypothetical protein
MRRLVVLILALISAAPAVATTVAMIRSPISTFYSQSGHAYSEHHQGTGEKTFGIVYKLNAAGEPIEQYRTGNWTPCCQVLVSEDGRTLIRFYPWEHSMPPACQVFQFYRDGKLVRAYEERELLRSVFQLEDAMLWHIIPPSPAFDLQPKFTQDGHFTLRGLNQWIYVFDATTGELITAHDLKVPLEQEPRRLNYGLPRWF